MARVVLLAAFMGLVLGVRVQPEGAGASLEELNASSLEEQWLYPHWELFSIFVYITPRMSKICFLLRF